MAGLVWRLRSLGGALRLPPPSHEGRGERRPARAVSRCPLGHGRRGRESRAARFVANAGSSECHSKSDDTSPRQSRLCPCRTTRFCLGEIRGAAGRSGMMRNMRCRRRPAVVSAYPGAVARVAVLLLALYLAVDIATPLLPGAFRFDLQQSIEVGGRLGTRVFVSAAPAASASESVPVVRHVAHRRVGLARRQQVAPRIFDLPRPARTDGASDTFDDD
jgi:hypothetical protein